MPSFLILRGVMAGIAAGFASGLPGVTPGGILVPVLSRCNAMTAYPVTPQMFFEGDRFMSPYFAKIPCRNMQNVRDKRDKPPRMQWSLSA
jgi:hypothetical protein